MEHAREHVLDLGTPVARNGNAEIDDVALMLGPILKHATSNAKEAEELRHAAAELVAACDMVAASPSSAARGSVLIHKDERMRQEGAPVHDNESVSDTTYA